MKSAAGGSFYSGDFVLFDTTIGGVWPFGNHLTFSIGTGISTIRYIPVSTAENYPSTPTMWHVNSPSTFSPGGDQAAAVRMLSESGPNSFGSILTTGTWYQLNTTRSWTVDTNETATGIFEMALWADTTTVLARATITLTNTS